MTATIVAAGVAFAFALGLTLWAARFFVRKGLGQPIHVDMPTEHQIKQGTPTMGGAVVIAAATVGYLAAHLVDRDLPSASGMLLLLLLVGLGGVGFLDDYLKISRARNLGLRARTKLVGQALIAILFAILATRLPDANGIDPGSTFVSFTRDLPSVQLGAVVFIVWALLMVSATSNGVNLIDGMDGLAAGTCTFVFGGYTMIALWQGEHLCSVANEAGCYNARDPHDLAVMAISVAAACGGFLWWNCYPARIFLGDTGALGLGGALAGMAIMTRTELLLIVIGGLYVAANASVIIQRSYFKLTRRLTGTPRRIFLSSPLQFHYRLKGWPEVTVVVRFWIISGILAAAGVCTFYVEWSTHS